MKVPKTDSKDPVKRLDAIPWWVWFALLAGASAVIIGTAILTS